MMYVGLEEFLSLPPGTIYMIEEDTKMPLFGFDRPIRIKGDTLSEDDWVTFQMIELQDDLNCEKCSTMVDEGSSVPVAGLEGTRHGLYPNPDEVAFWVLDDADHKRLIANLQEALKWQTPDEIEAHTAEIEGE